MHMIIRFWACEVANQDGCHRDRSSLFVWTTARYFYVRVVLVYNYAYGCFFLVSRITIVSLDIVIIVHVLLRIQRGIQATNFLS